MTFNLPDISCFRNMVLPCPQCAAPCTGTYKIWLETTFGPSPVEFDQFWLDFSFNDIISNHIANSIYEEAPKVLRDHNDGIGPFDVSAPITGSEIAPDDLIKLAKLLHRAAQTHRTEDVHLREIADVLQEIGEFSSASGVRIMFLDC